MNLLINSSFSFFELIDRVKYKVFTRLKKNINSSKIWGRCLPNNKIENKSDTLYIYI